MIDVAICDDNNAMCMIVHKEIERYMDSNSIECRIFSFISGEDLLQTDARKYHIFFLDIKLGGISGIETAKKIRKRNSDAIIIFLTAYDNYASDSYKVKASNYILKSELKKSLPCCMDDVLDEFHLKNQMIEVTQNHNKLQVKIDSIVYIESYGRQSVIHTVSGECISSYRSLHELSLKLRRGKFICPHKSYLVNFNHIATIRNESFIMDNKEIIPISRSNFERVKNEYLMFLE